MASTIPHVITSNSRDSVSLWINKQSDLIENTLHESGALLLRGFDVPGESGFESVVRSLCGEPLEYVYRSTPRTDLGKGIYTATEYPPGLSIPLHNENSYQRDWPLLLIFFCIRPAYGNTGQTPIADTTRVTNHIAPAIRRKFLEKGVMYVRNYTAEIDLPWTTVFQTTSRETVEKYCLQNDIQFQWGPSESLRTQQVCQAFAKHPRTGKAVWFNQAHLFHPSALDGRSRELMNKVFVQEHFPRNAFYGDGSPIEETALQNIRQAFEAEATLFEWQKGDILVLDNMRVSHGRTPYQGDRRVLAAMGRPFSSFIFPATTPKDAQELPMPSLGGFGQVP